jgi:hypothetical protein
MSNNPDLSFSVDAFADNLAKLNQVTPVPTKLPLIQALDSKKFIRADSGVFRNSDDHSVWRLERGEDGKEYITRTEDFAVAAASDWTAASNREGTVVTLAYQNYPVAKFAAEVFGFEDGSDFAGFLVEKAKANPAKFASGVLKTLPFESRIALQQKFALFRGA